MDGLLAQCDGRPGSSNQVKERALPLPEGANRSRLSETLLHPSSLNQGKGDRRSQAGGCRHEGSREH